MYSKDSHAQKYSYIRGQRWKCSWPFELLVSDKVTKLLLHWWPLRLCTYINRGHNLWTQYCRADSVTVAVPLLKCYRKACYYDSKHNIDQIRSHMQTKTKQLHWRPALKMYMAPETNLNKKNLLQLHSLPVTLHIILENLSVSSHEALKVAPETKRRDVWLDIIQFSRGMGLKTIIVGQIENLEIDFGISI